MATDERHIIVGILMLALSISQWMINRLIRPIRQLTQCAEPIGEGNIDAQSAVDERQEVSRLGEALKRMLTQEESFCSKSPSIFFRSNTEKDMF